MEGKCSKFCFRLANCLVDYYVFIQLIIFILLGEIHCKIKFLGRKIAIDASMCLYQFLIAVRSDGAQLTSTDGETTR